MNSFARRLIPGLILVLIGCAAPTQEAVKPEVSQVFPPAPAEPRYRRERTLYGSSDLVTKPKESGLLTFLIGDQKGLSARGDGLARPQALAVHHGVVYVANSLDSAVSVFDMVRRNFYKIGEAGPGALRTPSGLSVDRDGNLFVADAQSNAIEVFDEQGRYLRRIGGPKWFSHLTNVTADPKVDRVYAIDSVEGQHRVRVFNSLDGRHLFDFGTRGDGPGEFNVPYDLAVGQDGRLNVVDSGNFRVQIFDRDGKYLSSFGSAGKQPGQFARPKEIATDARGNLYVVDGTFGNIQIFDPNGTFLFFVGVHGDDGGAASYMLPSGIDIDTDGRLYVADQWYGKLDIFRPIPARMEKPSPPVRHGAKPSTERPALNARSE